MAVRLLDLNTPRSLPASASVYVQPSPSAHTVSPGASSALPPYPPRDHRKGSSKQKQRSTQQHASPPPRRTLQPKSRTRINRIWRPALVLQLHLPRTLRSTPPHSLLSPPPAAGTSVAMAPGPGEREADQDAAGGLGLGPHAEQQQREWPSPPRHDPFRVETVRTPIDQYTRLRFDPADGLLVNLPRDSAEYAAVDELCTQYRAGFYANRIESIERVSNPREYDKFWAVLEQYRRHKPHTQVCKLLHGTLASNKDSIAENNLIKEKISLSDYERYRPYYCGDGFYFTHSFPYAATYTTKYGVRSPLRHVFVFDVLVGDVDKPPQYTNKDKIPGLLLEWKRIFESKGLSLDEFMPSKIKLPVYMRYDTAQPRDEHIESFVKFQESEFYPTHVVTFRAGENVKLE
ncbi:Protein mono-ADP-ribosyltransferase PARP14 [Frankliniella fusca]|uniref:Protein mono-ADP-ribosyltransferase PARP14 n=1 Tax=Frankliniella fusca TaxID=407009 RepID=A0AAE1HQN0_9NEOP|nr:Protein mono-ADP-ribosyltransferase PARP14 [Frankliniella fusca]